MKPKTEWLKAGAAARPIGVDRKANMLNGMVLAQAGAFKSEGRGEFDTKSLKQIVALAKEKPTGLKSRFAHPSLSADGIGKYLGRVNKLYLSVAKNAAGEEVEAVRGDLTFDKTALDLPVGGGKPLGVYIMDLAESDPDALSSSLVLQVNEEYRIDKKTGARLMGDSGEELPPLWRPTHLHASDVVDTGDAVDGLLSANLSIEGLPDEVVRKAYPLAKQAFRGLSAAEIRRRLSGWTERIVSMLAEDEEEVPVDEVPSEEPAEEGELAVGDAVTWMVEDPSTLSAWKEVGTIVELGESVSIPDTSVTLDGAPAALVQCTDDGEPVEVWYLVDAAALTKAGDEEEPAEEDAPAEESGDEAMTMKRKLALMRLAG